MAVTTSGGPDASPVPARRPLHRQAHAVCPWGATTWGACDKATDDAKADWDAMQQVILAYNIVVRAEGKTPPWAVKEKGLFPQLIQLIAGDRDDFVNDDGNPHMGAWPVRLRAAIERLKAGDLPGYNLYEPIVAAHLNEGG